jgi:hypothetical protein
MNKKSTMLDYKDMKEIDIIKKSKSWDFNNNYNI